MILFKQDMEVYMKRIFGIVLAITLPAAILIAALSLTYRPGLPAKAQEKLNDYLQYQNAQSSVSVLTISQAQRIARPWNFTPEMSGGAFGDSFSYHTQRSYEELSATGQPAMMITDTWQTISAGGGGQLPLPYPPQDGWCILLAQAEQEQPKVIYILLHQDLYTADWIVHETPVDRSAEKLQMDLDSLGCQVDLP
jgi:hypothetical protein